MNPGEHDLPDDLIRYYRQVLAVHATVPEAGACAVCHVSRCPDWVDAFDRLATAGQVMGEPHHWEACRPAPRRHE